MNIIRLIRSKVCLSERVIHLVLERLGKGSRMIHLRMRTWYFFQQTFRNISCSFSKNNTESFAERELVEAAIAEQESSEGVSQEEKVHSTVNKNIYFNLR